MAKADQVKALLRAYAVDDRMNFYSVALQMAADEATRGHAKFAAELRELIEAAKSTRGIAPAPKAIPLVQPKGELSELLSASYPHEHIKTMVLASGIMEKLQRVLVEQRQHERLLAYSLAPRRKLLLVGPPGTGKTMTAAVLAGELRLPLFTVRFDSLITKFMGESASKLRLVFEAIKATRGVYFFDEFDSLGLQRGSQHDVAEMRRTLNMFLQLIERDDSNSLIVAATNHGKDLDTALFRRFDDVVRYSEPDSKQIQSLILNRLGSFAERTLNLDRIAEAGAGESHADVVNACNDALKDAIMTDQNHVSEESIIQHLKERAQMKLG
ncbi:AAA family ATPase [Limnobacter sp.]|jgi:SpoVK/Ycf46/Vps4 family AAA+-type ATPase|uniref:AAA family ATPase n=1 Tax=Limnobacter sp. TaxID=2003368 RepID=UPI0025C118F3|nr:AAA family ATPase [Limnobacter sp.]